MKQGFFDKKLGSISDEEMKEALRKANENMAAKDNHPVYEVIADFPENKYFPLGTMIHCDKKWNTYYWQYVIEDCQGKHEWLSTYFDKYPNIFKDARKGESPTQSQGEQGEGIRQIVQAYMGDIKGEYGFREQLIEELETFTAKQKEQLQALQALQSSNDKLVEALKYIAEGHPFEAMIIAKDALSSLTSSKPQ